MLDYHASIQYIENGWAEDRRGISDTISFIKVRAAGGNAAPRLDASLNLQIDLLGVCFVSAHSMWTGEHLFSDHFHD
ncbi:hypothetical protein T4E_9138 [Trichinella pseudospiralis]|uniref:Uncharacterized protein n=1 Tax=Trichinella pseudospiralis TaxID=6337 RepID=A0A0V0Y7Y5_TRIPS|nr:hypothetical protein T4E_9138 [Trichinella pseudospiralis]